MASNVGRSMSTLSSIGSNFTSKMRGFSNGFMGGSRESEWCHLPRVCSMVYSRSIQFSMWSKMISVETLSLCYLCTTIGWDFSCFNAEIESPTPLLFSSQWSCVVLSALVHFSWVNLETQRIEPEKVNPAEYVAKSRCRLGFLMNSFVEIITSVGTFDILLVSWA